MLLGFLTGDYRRVAEVHFAAGYVPPRQSLEAFAQACRSIGEPILERPLHEISLARLLAQLFEVTERFEMETQPQLLLLQKTMLVAEGVGRRLDPAVNMWTLARPMIEDWMRENRGIEARTVDAIAGAAGLLERLPSLVQNLEHVAATLVNDGLQLDDEALSALRARREAALLMSVPLWLIALALLAIAVALW
jgi:ubiquinone biosynthesis protein